MAWQVHFAMSHSNYSFTEFLVLQAHWKGAGQIVGDVLKTSLPQMYGIKECVSRGKECFLLGKSIFVACFTFCIVLKLGKSVSI